MLVAALTAAVLGLLFALTPGRPRASAQQTAGPPVIWRVSTTKAEVALTFDDGPDPTWTPRILQRLAAAHARATFFVLGSQAQRYPELVRQEASSGSEVCPHGWSHTILRGRSATRVSAEVARTHSLLAGLGVPNCRLFRFPYFASDLQARQAVAAMGYRIIAAGVDSRDWQLPGATVMAERVLAEVQPGAIILFHDGGGPRAQTAQAVGLVLAGLAKRGLTPVTLDRLLSAADTLPTAAAAGRA